MSEGEFIMPVQPEGAAMQFFIETLKANTDVLRSMQRELREDRKLLSDVRERVIRIESNRVDRRVDALERDVDDLKADRDKRDGALSAMGKLWVNAPIIAAAIVGITVIAFLIMKATGRIN